MRSTRHLFIATACLLATQLASAHARLLESAPKDGASLAAAPTQLRLKFNEALEAGFSSVTLTGADGVALPATKLQPADGDASTVLLPLPSLPAGAYKAQWSAMGRDGHRTKGQIAFTVK